MKRHMKQTSCNVQLQTLHLSILKILISTCNCLPHFYIVKCSFEKPFVEANEDMNIYYQCIFLCIQVQPDPLTIASIHSWSIAPRYKKGKLQSTHRYFNQMEKGKIYRKIDPRDVSQSVVGWCLRTIVNQPLVHSRHKEPGTISPVPHLSTHLLLHHSVGVEEQLIQTVGYKEKNWRKHSILSTKTKNLQWKNKSG